MHEASTAVMVAAWAPQTCDGVGNDCGQQHGDHVVQLTSEFEHNHRGRQTLGGTRREGRCAHDSIGTRHHACMRRHGCRHLPKRTPEHGAECEERREQATRDGQGKR